MKLPLAGFIPLAAVLVGRHLVGPDSEFIVNGHAYVVAKVNDVQHGEVHLLYYTDSDNRSPELHDNLSGILGGFFRGVPRRRGPDCEIGAMRADKIRHRHNKPG